MYEFSDNRRYPITFHIATGKDNKSEGDEDENTDYGQHIFVDCESNPEHLLGPTTPNKGTTRPGTSMFNKFSAQTKKTHRRLKSQYMKTKSTAKSLFAESVGYSDCCEDPRMLNRRIQQLESSLIEKENTLTRLNIDYSRLVKERMEVDKMRDENRKLKGSNKNYTDTRSKLKEIQDKLDKKIKAYEKLKTQNETLQANLKGLELKFEREKSIKHELQGKLARYDEDSREQHAINRELNEDIKEIDFEYRKAVDEAKQLLATLNKTTKELDETKDILQKYKKEDMKNQAKIKKLEETNTHLKGEIRRLKDNSKSIHSRNNSTPTEYKGLKTEIQRLSKNMEGKSKFKIH